MTTQYTVLKISRPILRKYSNYRVPRYSRSILRCQSYRQKIGSFVDEKNAVEFLDIYPYDRKDESVPTVEFTDVNFDYIKYSLTVYTPEYTNGRELSEVKPVSVYFDSDKDKSGIYEKIYSPCPIFQKMEFTLWNLIAVDKAGNESILNSNTYMRMVDSDVLAYISNSNAAKKTGWYSFQYENGDPISKRPDNFSDIDIVVLARMIPI